MDDIKKWRTDESLECTDEEVEPDDLLGILVRGEDVKGEVKHCHGS